MGDSLLGLQVDVMALVDGLTGGLVSYAMVGALAHTPAQTKQHFQHESHESKWANQGRGLRGTDSSRPFELLLVRFFAWHHEN